MKNYIFITLILGTGFVTYFLTSNYAGVDACVSSGSCSCSGSCSGSKLYRAIVAKEGGEEDGNIGTAALLDLKNAGYDTATMSSEEKFVAYTSYWIARFDYEDTDWNAAMIWRWGPHGPDKSNHDYGDSVCRIISTLR